MDLAGVQRMAGAARYSANSCLVHGNFFTPSQRALCKYTSDHTGFRCTYCRIRSIAAWSITCALFFDDTGAPYVHHRPRTQYKDEPKEYRKQKHSNKADDTTRPASRQHLNWVPNAITRGLGAVVPVLSCTYCISDGDFRIDITASITSKGTRNETERAKQREKKGEERDQRDDREKLVQHKPVCRWW